MVPAESKVFPQIVADMSPAEIVEEFKQQLASVRGGVRAAQGLGGRVKDLKRTASMDTVRRFIATQEAISPQLERRTVFLFYSESGVNDRVAAALADAGISVIDPKKLAAFEVW